MIEKVKKRNYHVYMISDDNIKKNFGIVVRELRLRKHLTQEKLAEYIDVQTQTISAIESGKTFISCEVLTKLANFFEVDPAIFFFKRVPIFLEEDLNYINEIKQLLPLFDSSKLSEIYKILLVIPKH